jgi:hypothetical protein
METAREEGNIHVGIMLLWKEPTDVWGSVGLGYCVRVKLSSPAKYKHRYIREEQNWYSNPSVPEYRSSWRGCGASPFMESRDS